MKYYRIFKHPSGDIQAIPEGWSWLAFLFGPMWALYHAMWAIGLGVMVASFGLAMALVETLPQVAEALMNIVLIATALVFGGQGHSWRARNLLAKGYAFVGSAVAGSAEAALAMVSPPAPVQADDDGSPQT